MRQRTRTREPIRLDLTVYRVLRDAVLAYLLLAVNAGDLHVERVQRIAVLVEEVELGDRREVLRVVRRERLKREEVAAPQKK